MSGREKGCWNPSKHREATRGNPTRTYRIWTLMRSRCNDKNNKGYRWYGGRGISVCERWNDYTAFLWDMGPAPDGSSIERIDNDGNYEPSNCCWATPREQARNKSSNAWLTLNGERMIVADWAARTGLVHSTIRRRMLRGWSAEEILTTPGRS